MNKDEVTDVTQLDVKVVLWVGVTGNGAWHSGGAHLGSFNSGFEGSIGGLGEAD